MFNAERSNESDGSCLYGVNSICLLCIHSSFLEVILVWQRYQIPWNFIGMTNREFCGSTNSFCNHFTQEFDYERWCNSSARQIYSQSASIDPSAPDLGHYLRTHRLTYVYTHVSIWLWDHWGFETEVINRYSNCHRDAQRDKETRRDILLFWMILTSSYGHLRVLIADFAILSAVWDVLKLLCSLLSPFALHLISRLPSRNLAEPLCYCSISC